MLSLPGFSLFFNNIHYHTCICVDLVTKLTGDTAKLHARKVAKILGAQDGLIYLPGAIETQWEDSDQGPPFRQRRS